MHVLTATKNRGDKNENNAQDLFRPLYFVARFIRDRACINDHLSIFFDMNGQFTLNNYLSYFTSGTSLSMTINSVWYAFLITFFTLIISYPTAYFLTKLKHKQLWLMLIILPTWVNLLLKAYAIYWDFQCARQRESFL